MIRARQELKYVVSEAKAAALVEYIRPLMCPDHHSPRGEYDLASLYLDSPDLRLYRDSREGIRSRFKLRIRSYGAEAGGPCFFEIKKRINRVIVKNRARVPQALVPALLAGSVDSAELESAECSCLEQFLCYQRLVHAAPLVRVRYQRQAFESRARDDVRVTFDRDLSFSVAGVADTDAHGQGLRWQCVSVGGVILEIKFTNQYPPWLNRLVLRFGLQQQSMSKYTRSVAAACGMRLCAPSVLCGADHGTFLAIS